MIKVDKHSIAGVVLAVICVAVLAGTGILNPIFANGLGNAPRELRLGVDIGIIQPQQCKSKKFLRSNITKKDFADKLAIVMNLVGVQNSDSKFMETNGIFDGNNPKSKLSRKEAVEMMARSTNYMLSDNIFKTSVKESKDFLDYKIPEKYSIAMAYMQNKFVVRGLSNNKLGSNRMLTQREAVYFLYRLYEAISSDMMAEIPNEGLCFIDLPYGHPIIPAIKNLTVAGAFDRSILRSSFDGDAFVTPEDLTEMTSGIFDRCGKEIDVVRLQTIFSDKEEYTSRKELTLVLEYLLDTFAVNKQITTKVDFVDVSEKDPEYQALSKLSGAKINPGYGNKIFAGNEFATWFETVNLLNEVLVFAGITNNPVDMSASADKEDYDRLKEIIKKKKAKIQNILGLKNKTEK